MILVDTSVWIDHFHQADSHLVDLLRDDLVASHPMVIGELALGSLARRDETLALLSELTTMPTLSHTELLAFVRGRGLWGRGLSLVDAHLLGSTVLVAGASLWTGDKRLRAAAGQAGVAHSVE